MPRLSPDLLHPRGARRRGWLLGLAAAAALFSAAAPAAAQGVELTGLRAARGEGGPALEYSARLTLSPSVEEALHRGVPMYFTAQASLFRNRWYWRDERVGRVARTWRIAYQPLTATWRVSLGGLSQPYPSLSAALVPLSRVSGWKLAEAERLEPGERYYVEFSLRLDQHQLPLPMQIDFGSDYALGVERTVRVE